MAGRKLATPTDATTPTPAKRGSRRSAAAKESTPDLGMGSRGTPAPTRQPEPPYLLVAHPDRWGVIEGMVVPLCQQLSMLPGCNGVDQNRRTGAPVVGNGISEVEKRGGKVIPFDIDGPGTSYLQKVEGGGWVSRWETLFSGSSSVRVDSKGYAKWLRGLIERGVIDDPPAYALDELIAQLDRSIEQAQKGGADKYAAKIKRLQADRDAAQKELDRVEELIEAPAAEAVPEL